MVWVVPVAAMIVMSAGVVILGSSAAYVPRLAINNPSYYWILLGLLMLPLIGGQLGLDLNVLRWVLEPPIDFVGGWIFALVGL